MKWVILIVVVLAGYVRLAPSDPARWHRAVEGDADRIGEAALCDWPLWIWRRWIRWRGIGRALRFWRDLLQRAGDVYHTVRLLGLSRLHHSRDTSRRGGNLRAATIWAPGLWCQWQTGCRLAGRSAIAIAAGQR